MNSTDLKNNINKLDESGKKDSLKIVLAGNPNVGKSVFFNKLTGTYVEVSNYSGTTVDISKATIDNAEIIDTPGIYGIGNYNDEEIVAKNIIVKADKIINVVNALSLDRDLFLTQQLIDIGIPFVIALNQIDEVNSRGIKIDIDQLEESLGVKIIPTVAIKDQGLAKVKDYVLKEEIHSSKHITPAIKELMDKHNISGFERVNVILDHEENMENREKIYSQRREMVNEVVEKAVSETDKGLNASTLAGKLLLNPIIGSLAAIIMLFALYQIIGVFVAGDVVNFLETNMVDKYYVPWISDLVSKIVSYEVLNEYLIGEFGVLTMAVKYILAVLLPLIFSFHLFMAILEDSGYLPRIAVLTDRFLSKLGLNGRAIIPIILGFGCTTMATITTRILGSKRERTIATAMLGLSIPCSAQLGIIIGLIAAIGGLKAWVIYLVTIFSVFALVGTVLNRVLPGKSSPLLIDLPIMRFPILKNVFKKTVSKTKHFLMEATPLFIIGSIIITTLQLTDGISCVQTVLEPLTVSILGLPKETAVIFIMGIIRRDFASAGLAEMAGINGGIAILNSAQILTSIIVLTLFVPCIIAVTVLFKERGYKEAIAIWLGSWVVAFAVGGILSQLLRFIF